ELYAILLVLTAASKTVTIYIFTDSTYAIRSICHWAPRRAARGWVCLNADILKDIVAAIKARRAATHFFWVEGHSGNAHNDAADTLAKQGA
ncbi:ribonuclease H-like protein, partial [Athelia psychrophila]